MVKTTNQVRSEFFDDSQMVAGSWEGFPSSIVRSTHFGPLGIGHQPLEYQELPIVLNSKIWKSPFSIGRPHVIHKCAKLIAS